MSFWNRAVVVVALACSWSFVSAQTPCPTPVVTTVLPASGPSFGGVAVTLTGSGFTGATTVTFGGVAATGVTVVDDATITATTPAGAVGSVAVVVANGCGGLGSLAAAYLYEPGLDVVGGFAVGATNTAFDGYHVRVATGGVLTVSGSHAFASLLVLAGGLVTHPLGVSLQLTIVGDATVAAGGSIHCAGRGHAQGQGQGAGVPGPCCNGGGGGAHGGNGGSGTMSGGGAAYGHPLSPVSFGSGGGVIEGNSGSLGKGGGAIRLIVGGMLTVSGALSADGENGSVGGGDNYSGGGAGGSLWITATHFAGSGTVSANGGTGAGGTQGGGGGGGRIAIESVVSTFAGVTSAVGGAGAQRGGAGSVATTDLASGSIFVAYDNGGNVGATSNLPAGFSQLEGDLHIVNGAVLSQPFGGSFSLSVVGSMTVGTTGGVTARARGFGQGQGPGSGLSGPCCNGGGGGAHGGNGGHGTMSGGGAAYGSPLAPTTAGSGGGIIEGNSGSLGRGGGVLRMTVTGSLNLDGLIDADGEVGSVGGGDNYSGGGAGGSVWITAGQLSGSGTVRADGGTGAGTTQGGGGGGGRVYVESFSTTFIGTLRARGGAGWQRGGAGSVGSKNLATGAASIVYENDGYVGADSDLPAGLTTLNADLVIANGATLSQPFGGSFSLEVLGDVTVGPSGGVSARARGLAQGQGPGAGLPGPCCNGGGGGAHGGNGGTGNRSGAGTAYGSPFAPSSPGSGGGIIEANSGSLGRGGGVVRLVVAGALTVDGVVDADGEVGSVGGGDNYSGGGGGGSVWITTDQFFGSGLVRADGGAGAGSNQGGGGSGGRVAVEFAASSFSGAVRAFGGNGFQRGGAGSVVMTNLSVGTSTVTYDNGGSVGATSDWKGGTELPANLVVDHQAVLTQPFGGTFNLTVLGTVTVGSTGRITAVGRGFPQATGPGAGASCCPNGGGGGGGHGGAGGNGTVSVGGGTYGTAATPTTAGSGGGRIEGNSGSLGKGGGVIRLFVAESLVVDGVIDADGEVGSTGGGIPDNHSGGGGGGSVWINARTLSGIGVIRADGGAGAGGNQGGGGGGGRVAVYLENCPTGGVQLRAFGGTGWQSGQNGSVYLLSRCNVHVGPNGAFADLQSAVNAVTTGDVTFVVAPGVYAPFNVTLNTARALRFVAEDPNAPPIVDTATAGPVTVAGTATAAFVSFEDFDFGSPTSQYAALKFDTFAGVGMVERCTLDADTAPVFPLRPALWIVDAPGVGGAKGVSVQRSVLAGFPALLADGASRVSVHNGALFDVVAVGAAAVAVAGAAPAVVAVPPAFVDVDPAPAPDLDTPKLLVPGEPFVVTLVGQPGRAWLWAFGPAPSFDFFPTSTLEGALLLDTALWTLGDSDFNGSPDVGLLDAKGLGVFVVPTPPSLPLLGSTLFVQAASFDPVLGLVSFSNLQVAQGGF